MVLRKDVWKRLGKLSGAQLKRRESKVTPPGPMNSKADFSRAGIRGGT